MNWREFILEHGFKARTDHLSAAVGQPVDAIRRLRAKASCRRHKPLDFPALFHLWHGRAPRSDEWPPPALRSSQRSYEWLTPEITLLTDLVGRVSKQEIVRILTTRLRRVTGDQRARRSPDAVQAMANGLGLRIREVRSGLTVTEAARRVGSRAIINYEIYQGRLRTFRIGRLHVIPLATFEAWQEGRRTPPTGWVRLASVKAPLGIKYDKLAEYASLGYVPHAVKAQDRCWYIPPSGARQLVRDARSGKPLPWHGKPLPSNLRQTWRKWRDRQHRHCPSCRQIWGAQSAPRSFEEFCRRYPPLSHGAKHHLTYRQLPGLTTAEAGRLAGVPAHDVARAIRNGLLPGSQRGRRWIIKKADLTRWIARKRPAAINTQTTLSITTAIERYGLSRRRILSAIRSNRLKLVTIANGPARGEQYLLRHQVAEFAKSEGYTLAEATRRVGISPYRLKQLLHDLNWRSKKRVPFATVRVVKQRLTTPWAHSLDEAARVLHRPLRWIRTQIRKGVVRPSRSRADRRRLTLSEATIRKLAGIRNHRATRRVLHGEWWLLSQAAHYAGVSNSTLINWNHDGRVNTRPSPHGTLYSRRTIERQARRYWAQVRFKRAITPKWLETEPQRLAAA